MKSFIVITMVGIVAISSLFIANRTVPNETEEKNEIQETTPQAYVEAITLKKDKIYLAVNGTEKLSYDIQMMGEPEIRLTYQSENEAVCQVDETGALLGVGVGTTNIVVTVNDKVARCEVTVTDLLIPMPTEPDSEKELITGHTYTQEQNDLLDTILYDRVNQAGEGTRAGAVAAARFIGLEFPYRMPYFSENGRLNTYGITNYCDGEGRYYHKGLYLHASRFNVIEKSLYGPATWGTYLYCIPSQGKRANGFDCSGFISWIVLNGGFDPGDVGAGVSEGIPDMTDLGEKKVLKTSIEKNDLKAGDLLSGKNSDGGHIAFIAGITEDKYYVAESLWAGTGYFGAIIRTYEHDKLKDIFYWHIDMDEFYGEEGNYTAYWMEE